MAQTIGGDNTLQFKASIKPYSEPSISHVLYQQSSTCRRNHSLSLVDLWSHLERDALEIVVANRSNSNDDIDGNDNNMNTQTHTQPHTTRNTSSTTNNNNKKVQSHTGFPSQCW